MLNVTAKNCVVVGGGKVATRKIATLLDAKANVTVVSPEITNEIAEWSKNEQIILRKRCFQAEDVEGAFLVIAATNHADINLQVAHAVHHDQLINVVDNKDYCNFIVPTVANRGNLTIAISTSGTSPFLAKKIKDDLLETYDEVYENYLDFLEESRQQIKATIHEEKIRTQLYKQLVDPIFLSLTRKNEIEKRNKLFADILNQIHAFSR